MKVVIELILLIILYQLTGKLISHCATTWVFIRHRIKPLARFGIVGVFFWSVPTFGLLAGVSIWREYRLEDAVFGMALLSAGWIVTHLKKLKAILEYTLASFGIEKSME